MDNPLAHDLNTCQEIICVQYALPLSRGACQKTIQKVNLRSLRSESPQTCAQPAAHDPAGMTSVHSGMRYFRRKAAIPGWTLAKIHPREIPWTSPAQTRSRHRLPWTCRATHSNGTPASTPPIPWLDPWHFYEKDPELKTAGLLHSDPDEWTRRAILNTGNMGKFSSDRSIQEYAQRIWGVRPPAF